jgi:hypothetical protein
MSDTTDNPLSETPLTMTVHSLPTPGLPDQRRYTGRWKMLAVMLVCAAPVIASYFTYYVVRPEGRRNYGELVDPQRALPDLLVPSLNGATVDLPTLKGQWLLVSVAGGACAQACQQHLYVQRQLRESLGREKDRLERVWLVSDDAPVPPALLPQVATDSIGALALRMPAEAIAQWLQPGQGHAVQDHLYLVDPKGNWMLRFPAAIDPAKAKRDLERLLRASASWDRAGREGPGGA